MKKYQYNWYKTLGKPDVLIWLDMFNLDKMFEMLKDDKNTPSRMYIAIGNITNIIVYHASHDERHAWINHMEYAKAAYIIPYLVQLEYNG